MAKRIKVIAEGYYTPDLDGDGYKGVEWPAGSGEHRDLTTIEEVVQYDQQLVDDDNMSPVELIDFCVEVTARLEVVDEDTVDPSANAFDAGHTPPADNPFEGPEDEDTTTYHERHGEEPTNDAGAKAESDTAAANQNTGY